MDGSPYPRDAVLTIFEDNCNLEQHGDLKLFYKDYVGEELLLLCISYPGMKNFYLFQVTDI